MNTITRDDWLKALTEAEGPTNQDALAVNEFAELASLPRKTAGDRLERMVKSGRAMRTHKHVTTASGQRRRVAAYLLVKPEPKRKGK